jgi:hypothetical protein
MDGQVLSALQLEVVELEGHLGVLACPAGLGAEDMAYELGTFGNLGTVGSLDCRLGLDHDAVSSLCGF